MLSKTLGLKLGILGSQGSCTILTPLSFPIQMQRPLIRCFLISQIPFQAKEYAVFEFRCKKEFE